MQKNEGKGKSDEEKNGDAQIFSKKQWVQKYDQRRLENIDVSSQPIYGKGIEYYWNNTD